MTNEKAYNYIYIVDTFLCKIRLITSAELLVSAANENDAILHYLFWRIKNQDLFTFRSQTRAALRLQLAINPDISNPPGRDGRDGNDKKNRL